MIGRQVDECIERLIADVEVQRRHTMALALQPLGEFAEMSFLEQDGRPIVDRVLVVEIVELRRMDGDTARA